MDQLYDFNKLVGNFIDKGEYGIQIDEVFVLVFVNKSNVGFIDWIIRMRSDVYNNGLLVDSNNV